MRDDNFKTNIGVVKLHSTEGRHWIAFINET